MKRNATNKALAVALGLAFTASAHAEVIISDTFTGTPEGATPIRAKIPACAIAGGRV